MIGAHVTGQWEEEESAYLLQVQVAVKRDGVSV